eukprot:gnl/TRDRNA2_/TRDRNA2_136107_c0_seq1.p1 gnl/TRDRNA2_/TRDRNA2_136107_c0~~gnl/TRDRNA2_/TRDRNA2_136107_c0_seq1.p1  ORF type:complete len:262 (+),score=36.97 gnl/TRDRNA2_/TRDRNA2_136107_c0_seq1:658-1443(+)
MRQPKCQITRWTLYTSMHAMTSLVCSQTSLLGGQNCAAAGFSPGMTSAMERCQRVISSSDRLYEPFFGDRLPVLQTREQDRYRSFFVIKTPGVDQLVASRPAAEVLARSFVHDVVRENYRALYEDAVVDAEAGESSRTSAFRKRCLEHCFRDCEERLRVVTGQPSASVNSPIPMENLCIGGVKWANGTVVRHEAASWDSDRYVAVCKGRCEVTCEQRLHLFEASHRNLAGDTGNNGECLLPSQGVTGSCKSEHLEGDLAMQ